ncbi:MAG: hypothetical protein NTZ33_02070 [Bacteroidetes bacterium]|nr:hypothetical protein [Bacteroidota bacterium]
MNHFKLNIINSYIRYLLISVLLFISLNIKAQSCKDKSVQLTASIQENPVKITLHWVANEAATSYLIYKKLKTDVSWGNLIDSIPGTVNQYTDSDISTAVSYEYKVVRNAHSFKGYGYINSGIKIPAVEQRGIIILLIDSSLLDSLSMEIYRLEKDLQGDGWQVRRHDVSRSASVKAVKSIIINDYSQDSIHTKAVLLLGHIAVPYSGDLMPDGHAEHWGAWPADLYYAETKSVWTDSSVNVYDAVNKRNYNIPGDGKFDQSDIPSDIELQLGRIDLSNLSAFKLTEIQLLKNYLDKDHAYRHKEFTIAHKALIDDNFENSFNEAFAANGWKNFSPLVGSANIAETDYFTSMQDSSYLWSYGCGTGSYTGCTGIGSTSDFAKANLQGIFTLFFGSFYGDWDVDNSFLRAPLAQGKMLTTIWCGRPHMQFHHMAMGETIGYAVKLSQNNDSLYYPGLWGSRKIHTALMGDPSLRNDVVAPVSNLKAEKKGRNCRISWNASKDEVLGYYIYRKSGKDSNFCRLNKNIITQCNFIDNDVSTNEKCIYMVKAILLEHTPSGSYYNLSQGINTTTN